MSGIDKQRLRAGNFVSNNSRVLRTINILWHQYNKLSGIQNVLEENGVSEDEFLDAVNFLALEGYIHLREVSSKHEASLADKLGPVDHSVHLLMDRAYEGDETRALAVELGYVPVVPPKSNRRNPWDYDKKLYKQRNQVERLFRRLK